VVLIDGGYGRLRDIAVGSDGFVYLITHEPGLKVPGRGVHASSDFDRDLSS
jgi:hypothetical protein